MHRARPLYTFGFQFIGRARTPTEARHDEGQNRNFRECRRDWTQNATPHPLGLADYRQFLYGIFSFRNEVHAQTPTESAIAIKKHFPIEDFPPLQSKLPAATGHVYFLLTISAYH
jgi:hypothetical protein